MVQVARIAGQLLQDNLQRELADLAFDTDLLVVKRDNTFYKKFSNFSFITATICSSSSGASLTNCCNFFDIITYKYPVFL